MGPNSAQDFRPNTDQSDTQYFEVFRVDAWIRTAGGDFVEARNAYETAIELNPKWAPLHFWFGQFLMQHGGDLDEARARLLLALQLDPMSSQIKTELARTQLYMKRFEDAATSIGELIQTLDNLPFRRRRIIFDLKLQLFARKADHLLSQRAYVEAFHCLEDLKRAFIEIPRSLLDTQMRVKLSKSVQCVQTCVYHISDEAFRQKAVQLLDWMRQEAVAPRS